MTDFDKLYIDEFDNMVIHCDKMVNDIDFAKDIVQSCFIKIYSKKIDLSVINSRAWIKSVVRNHTIDKIRSKKETISFDMISYSHGEDPYEKEDDDIETKQEYDKMMTLIKQLSPQYRKCLTLYLIDNYTHNEIAAELNIGIGTSKANLHKAKAKLRELTIQVKTV
jgi:RNA polymerase sigma factor (sigma-70 family)